MHRTLALTVALLAWSCGSREGVVTYEKDIRPLMEDRCTSCHVQGGIAPFQLTSYEQVADMKAAILAAVQNRTMPPYYAAPGCAEYADDQNLTDEQLQALDTWVQAGAPRGSSSGSSRQSTLRAESLPRVDLRLGMAEPWTPSKEPDDYHCFVLDWPNQTDTYVTGFNVRPGNAKVAHHAIAFLIPPDRVKTVMDLDDAEPGPGYTCYGGPGGNGSSIAWVGSWAPGAPPSMYPNDTGLLIRPGSKIVLQMHYNTSAASVASERTDQTLIELALAENVGRKAFIMPWANPDWVRNRKMVIAAGDPQARHQFEFDPTPFLKSLSGGSLQNNTAIRIHATSLHQHMLGSGGRVEIARADDSTECLLNMERYDFHWQRAYAFAQPKTLRVGDRLKLACTWNNSAEHQPVINGVRQPVREVNWGEGTGDEMCLGILYVSE